MADYFRVDLHIHTNYSNMTKHNDYKGVFSLDDLIEKLNTVDDNVQLFSLTDHNIFNVPTYLDYFSRYSGVKNRELIVGIELDIYKQDDLYTSLKQDFEGTKIDANKYHAILVFKSKDIAKLSSFLDRMYQNISEKYNDRFRSTNGFSEINLNDNAQFFKRKTSLEKIVEFFYSEEFLIIAHGNKSNGIVKAYSSELSTAQRMIIMGIVNSVELSPGKAVEVKKLYELGFDKILRDDFKNYNQVACLVFSDNHEIIGYPFHDKEQKDAAMSQEVHTYIKGDLTFETLRLAFVDPLSRIKLSTNKPMKPIKYLDEIKFCTNDYQKNVIDHSIRFSPGLNCIIGGRSSGKSLLFNAVLDLLNQKSKVGNYTKADNCVLGIDSIQGKTNMSSFEKKHNCDVIAYSQEEIIEMFEKSGKQLKKSLEFDEFKEEEVNAARNAFSEKISSLSSAYENLFLNKSKRNSLVVLNDFINLSKRKDLRIEYKDGISVISKGLVESSQKYKEIIDDLNRLVVMTEKSIQYTINDKSVFSAEDISVVTNAIKVYQSRILKLTEDYKKVKFHEIFRDLLSFNLHSLEETIATTRDKEIIESKARIKERINQSKEFLLSTFDLKSKCDDITGLDISLPDKNKEVTDKFILHTYIDTKINKETFYEFLYDKIKGFETTLDLNTNLLNLVYKKNDCKIKRAPIGNDPSEFSQMIEKMKTEILDEFKPKYNIIEKTELDGIKISSDFMSPGKRASTFLEIVLGSVLKKMKKDTIILIDQPEDNLDNEFISKKLIQAIREVRDMVQVILVTHNASIVINSDTENVIIAENLEGKIQYTIDGIENIPHREKICEILDGGRYIFDMRYRKYNIEVNKLLEGER